MDDTETELNGLSSSTVLVRTAYASHTRISDIRLRLLVSFLDGRRTVGELIQDFPALRISIKDLEGLVRDNIAEARSPSGKKPNSAITSSPSEFLSPHAEELIFDITGANSITRLEIDCFLKIQSLLNAQVSTAFGFIRGYFWRVKIESASTPQELDGLRKAVVQALRSKRSAAADALDARISSLLTQLEGMR